MTKSFFFLIIPNKMNHMGEQKVSGLCAVCVFCMGSWYYTLLYIRFTFQFPICAEKRLVGFNLFPLFHFKSIVFFNHFFRSYFTQEIHQKLPLGKLLPQCCSSFFLSVFYCSSGKATFRSSLQSKSSCCCLRPYTTLDYACQDIYRSNTHTQFVGLTPTPATQAHALQVQHIVLCPCCYA